ncbi:tetratricopeptide repeat protein [Streptomyces fildesensis]|uniref:Tetratricopeptide repeat protein n=1 Tax=Streptomyces fildesensis TaxID=375757 RepID=A0ABW8CDZ8_9ACTN
MADATDSAVAARKGPRDRRPGRAQAQVHAARRLGEARIALAAGDAATAADRFRAALATAGDHELADEQVAALLGLGDCALETGELTVAREHFEAVEKLLAGEPLPRRATAIRGRAVSHLLAGELRYACHLLESAIDGLHAAGTQDPDALLLLHTAVIAPYMDMGAHARAAQAAELALALAPSATEPALVAGMHRSVARTLIAEGRIAEADASLAKAQELYQRLGFHSDLAKCHWMRGYVHAQGGNLEHAERELRLARDMLAAQRSVLFADQVEVELADVLRRRGSHSEAGELLARLLDRIGPERGAIHAAGAHRLLGLIAQEDGELEAAEEHYVNALSLLERAGAAGDLADLCRLLGDLLRSTGRVEAALDAYRTGLGHRAAIGTTTLGPAPAKPQSRPPAY